MSSVSAKNSENTLKRWLASINSAVNFIELCTQNECIKSRTFQYFKEYFGKEVTKKNISKEEWKNLNNLFKNISTAANNIRYDNRQNVLENIDPNDINSVRNVAGRVYDKLGKQGVANLILAPCAESSNIESNGSNVQNTQDVYVPDGGESYPFDRRLDRLEMSISANEAESVSKVYTPFASAFAELSTTSYIISQQTLNEIKSEDERTKALNKVTEDYKQMAKDEFYKGVPALQNYYALTRLYGSSGGKYLVNAKNQRRWYEVDSDPNNPYNYSSTPTTSALVSWGRGDPYGRTPYQFTDFVFCKYWNKIQNNRLITLRRYAAPILDNLKFPGMINSTVTTFIESDNKESISLSDTTKTSSKPESTSFPPMATVVTYLGEETGNKISTILKFSTGLKWKDINAAIWEATTDSVPDANSGIGSIFGSIGKIAEIFSVAGGDYNREMVQNNGQLPPDPYRDGPYENRIMGPVNRIDSVKARDAGLNFENTGLSLTFEYVARPIGGINTKAVLLDILSNFLIIGSASAVFFGGAHRFMAAPAKYPFLGGGKGIERWYKGDAPGWALSTVENFTGGGKSGLGNLTDVAKNALGDFFSNLFSGAKSDPWGALTSMFTEGNPFGNIVKNEMAKKTAGQIPYMHGMKAILTGEPVGEWHLTIGNPLNPIAMIGNLVCTGIEVEFNDELGPDDFPTELKIVVKLDHAMPRDRDAIESMFNRGMGRIYMLPDSFSGSADYQSVVDAATKKDGRTSTGTAPNGAQGILYQPGMDNRRLNVKQAKGKSNPLHSMSSVWNRAQFSAAISENSTQQFVTDVDLMRQSAYRAADWIAQKSLK